MSLKILIAGCLPKDRRHIENVVKKAFGEVPESDPWSISLVKMGASWSISLEGPELKDQCLSLTAPEDHLREAIVEALGTNGTAGPAASPPPAPSSAQAASPASTASPPPAASPAPTASPPRAPSPMLSLEEMEAAEGLLTEGAGASVGTIGDAESRDRYDCSACGHPFKVVYTARPHDSKIMAPVACPKCWQVTQVSLPESIASTQEYRAESIAT